MAPPGGQVYQFPDGTGSITLPEGWRTQAQSAMTPVAIGGPNNESVWIGNSIIVSTPDSPMVQTMQRNQQMMQQMGGNPPPPPPIIIATFSDPLQAITDITPQISKITVSKGGQPVRLDKVISSEEAKTMLPGGKAAMLNCAVTRTIDGKEVPFRNMQQVQMALMNNGTWMFISTGYTAPADTFDRDSAVMKGIIQSEQLNSEVVAQRQQQQAQQNMAMIRQQGEANSRMLQQQHEQYMQQQQQRFEAGQAQHAEQTAEYDRHNQQFRDDQLQKSRNNADFVETIRGTRTIYDTQTGESATANLTSAGAVVDDLNKATLDPNRFVQIPLRDELYPLPAGK